VDSFFGVTEAVHGRKDHLKEYAHSKKETCIVFATGLNEEAQSPESVMPF
jgi:hypothetical protein